MIKREIKKTVLEELVEMNLIFHLRNGIDNKHQTPMLSALSSLHSFISFPLGNFFFLLKFILLTIINT